MKQSQLWLDTFSLLANGSISHSSTPDEHFELPKRRQNQGRVQRVILAQATRILFVMGIIAVAL